MKIFDVVIVGSGPAGVHAAYPLVEAGLRVAMVDGGLNSTKRDRAVSSANTSTTKSNALDILMKGSFAFGKTYELLKVRSNIEIIQTLAKGGLSEFWHGISDYLTSGELQQIGLPAKEIEKQYKETSRLVNLDLKPPLDIHGELLLRAAPNKVYRLPVTYPYRTSTVVEDLKKYKNFTYIPGQLVLTIKDENKHVEIKSLSIEGLKKTTFRSQYLILAAGAINTTRILLRSFGLFDYKTNFLTKSHSMVVCLHARSLIRGRGTQMENPGQLAFMSNRARQKLGSFVQLYRCNPFMLDHALAYIPLPKIMARVILSMFIRSLVIADVRFPAFETKEKFLRLRKDTEGKDVLEISFRETSKELKSHETELKGISETLRSLGLFPLKVVSDPITSHYGGGVPFGKKSAKLSVGVNGKLHQAKNIYIADSAPWRALPGKPLALTIMANASRVGKLVLKRFNRLSV
jgi:choline dehydrogenase-like flavoprotein